MTDRPYRIALHFGSVIRQRDMPVVPRLGDIVCIEDGGEAIRLRVDAVFHIEDRRRSEWSIRVNCTVEEWTGAGERRSFSTIPQKGGRA